MTLRRNGIPSYRPDIYSTDAIVDPYPHYARLRELGPVVWLARQRVYAVPRYAECKLVLRDDKTFSSGNGTHACAGQGLARLETTAMLNALLQRVERIDLVGTPTWAINNIIRRHERLPLKLIGN
jgi:cytochrome P450